MRHRQQHRNVLDYLTEAVTQLAGVGRPHLRFPGDAALLRHRLWSLGRVPEPLYPERLPGFFQEEGDKIQAIFRPVEYTVFPR